MTIQNLPEMQAQSRKGNIPATKKAPAIRRTVALLIQTARLQNRQRLQKLGVILMKLFVEPFHRGDANGALTRKQS